MRKINQNRQHNGTAQIFLLAMMALLIMLLISIASTLPFNQNNTLNSPKNGAGGLLSFLATPIRQLLDNPGLRPNPDSRASNSKTTPSSLNIENRADLNRVKTELDQIDWSDFDAKMQQNNQDLNGI